MTSSAIEAAISTLANTMRLYVESHMRFGQLFKVDREEAIDNLDRAFEAKLEAFHTLYDVSRALFGYFDHGDTAMIIAIRNAIHHRDHPLFRSLQSRLFLDGNSHLVGASFLLASYPTLHGASIRMHHYVKLEDIRARLDPDFASPHLEAMMKIERAERRFALIEQELALEKVREQGSVQRFPDDQVYLDLVPVFTSAVCRVFKAMKLAGIAFKGFDAETYVVPFTTEIEVDLAHPIFAVSRVEGRS
ncbi:MAG: hypothetical protein RLZZ444_54 [Pseudomonadota bacterium]